MAVIRTVNGDLSPDSFDLFHCHEHIWIDGSFLGPESPVRPIDDFEKSLSELKLLKKGTLLVDCQPLNVGGDFGCFRRLSAESGIGIVASTGFHKLCFYRDDSRVLKAREYDLRRSFFRQAGRCGIIKTAVEKEGITGRYEVLHTAAARTASETGLKVIVHTDPGSDALGLLDFYARLGVEESCVILCHLDRTEPDIGIHIEAARRGAFLEYDTIARPKYHTDEDEIGIIGRVCGAGYEKNVLLGLDTTRERLRSYCENTAVGLDYLENNFIKKLRGHGFDEKTVELMIRDNPRKAISFVPKEIKK
ncbi:MAG: phosphotriesterase [Clostridia bacterium]|nr:phosphotriesterase [Clostridia bacterium]